MKKTVTIISIIAFLALVYYCIRYFQEPVKTISALTETREETVQGDAYIVRDETIYATNESGVIYSYAREGARIGNNRKIFAIYDSDVNKGDLAELMTVNDKISELSSVITDGNSYSSASGSEEEQLLQLYERIEAAAIENNIEEIAECKAEIQRILNGEEEIGKDERIEELTRQRDEIEARIPEPKDVVYSDQGAGIYSTKIDGYENVLSLDSINNITVEKFNNISAEDGSTQNRVCKIINNHEWYVMALVKRNGISDVKIGDTVGIRFSGLPGEETTATVKYISTEHDGDSAVIVLKCESYSEGAFSIRRSNVEIIKESHTGFEVPIDSIRNRDGQSGVYVRTGGDDIFKPCKIIYTDEANGTAIIVADTEDTNRQLRQYDVIVVGEKW